MDSQIEIYQSADGQTRVEVKFEDETVWLSQQQLTELFGQTKQNISLHISNIFKEGELSRQATVKEYLTVQTEGKRKVKRNISYYNLDVIISVGYRIKSKQGILFRQWATRRLKDYLIKGNDIKQHWDLIPHDTDILITHGPAFGILDMTIRGEHTGCEELLRKIERVRPKLHVFGHIHEDYGQETRGDTVFVNASVLDSDYQLEHKPITLSL